MINDTYLKAVIDKATVARLATADSECKPHLVPVVFVFDNGYYFVLLIDEYNEDWRQLYFIMIQGKASIIGGKELEENEQVY